MRKFITYDKLYTLYAAKQRQRCDFAYVYMISNRIVNIPKWHAGLVAFPLNWLKPCKRHQYQSNFLQFLGILSSILIKYRRRDEFIIKPLCFFLFVNICVLKGGMTIFFLYLLNLGIRRTITFSSDTQRCKAGYWNFIQCGGFDPKPHTQLPADWLVFS